MNKTRILCSRYCSRGIIKSPSTGFSWMLEHVGLGVLSTRSEVKRNGRDV